MTVNGEFVCELVRAHYDGDEARFAVLVDQVASGAAFSGSTEVAARLRSLLDSGHPAWRDEWADAIIARSQKREQQS
jgi:hypothetical protein